jgi:TP901 family phage tail tape measure protein
MRKPMSDRSVTVWLKAEVAGYVAGIEKASLATKDLAKTTEASATQNKASWDKAGVGMLAVGAVLAAGVGVAVMAYTEFDHTMSTVKANIDDKSVPSMQRLADAAMTAGKVTEFSATAAAQAEVQLSKVGVTSAQITGGALVGVLALAAATEIDLPTAASIAAAAMNQFGLSAAQIPHVADLLASAANHALGGVIPLSEALKFVGVAASQFGISIDSTVGVLAMFASNGITGTMAGTGFRMMLIQMAKPTAEATDLMKQYNITAFDSQGKFVGMATLAGELHTQLGGLTVQQREHTLAVMFGTRALAEANILYAQGSDGVKKWTDTVNQQGFAEMQASTKLNNLAGDMQIFGTSVNVALIKEGSAGNGVLRDMAQFATGAVNAFGDLPAPLQAGTLKLAGLTGGVLILGGTLITIVPKILTTWAALDKVSVAGVSGTTAIKGLGVALIAVGIALPLIGAAGDAVRSSLGEMAPGANVAADGLLQFATNGKAAGASAQLINNGFRDLGHTIYEVFSTSVLHNADAAISKITSVYGLFGTQADDAVQFFKTLDSGLSGLAANGHAAEAATLFNKVAAAAKAQGYSMSQVADALPAYSAQVAGAGKAASTAAQSVDDLARSNAKTGDTLVAIGGKADATGSAMRLIGAGADAASTAVKDLAKAIQTDMDAASKAFQKDTDVLGNYDPAKQVAAVATAQDALAKALKAGSGVEDAQNALDQAKRDQANASLGASYATQIKAGQKFATDIAAVTAKGLDPNVIAKLLQEGPAKAEPALQAMLSGNSSKMIAMVNDGEKQLAAINQRVIENARLTSMAVNSQSDQMSKDFSAAMSIDNAIATSGGKATVASLAAQLHIGAADVKRIAAEFGIGILDGVAGGVTPSKSKIDELQAKIDSIKQGHTPGISANTKAGQQVIADYQAQIDALTQHKPPVLDANAAPGHATVNTLQTAITGIRQGTAPVVTANTAPGKSLVDQLQTDVFHLQGKTVTVGVTTNFSMGTGGANSMGFFTNGKDGGPVTGGIPGQDSVPRMLMPNEYIVRADGSNLGDAMAHYGVPGMAKGGPLAPLASISTSTQFNLLMKELA